MDKNDDLETTFAKYLNSYKTLSLATMDETGAKPDCSTMYFGINASGHPLVAADASTNRARALKTSGLFACTMDDGGTTARGLKISGRARRLTSPDEISDAKQAIISRIPSLKKFFEQSEVEFFELVPERRIVINFAWGVNWKLEVSS